MDKNKVEVKEALIDIPSNAVKLEIKATLLDDDLKFYNAKMDMDLSMISDAFIDAAIWLDENGKWVLTEKGEELANEVL